MSSLTPWTDSDWRTAATDRMNHALETAGHAPTGPAVEVASSGRAWHLKIPTEQGMTWVKHCYRLPPGEEQVLEPLVQRWPELMPQVIATWEGGFATAQLPGAELQEDAPVEHWTAAARALATMARGERDHVQTWLDLGVRDRRPASWAPAVEALLASPVMRALPADELSQFEHFVPEFITRFVDAFAAPATLVPQDSGCCNIHVHEGGVVLYDWADVVIGHPVFSCDRLLDQVPRDLHDDVIDAFLEPLELERGEYDAMRRSNVLHEVLRYHDELAYMSSDHPNHAKLAEAARSQVVVLTTFEASRH
ncbi:MAG: hypothetical protein AAF533_16535 [Acidobacteriota bacterium]